MTRILIVDDSPMDRLLANRLLGAGGEFVIEYAEDGGIALAKIDELAPDLVITDMLMPQVTGLELVERVRVRYPYIPVVLMTANGSEEIAARALQAGAASYVPKADLPNHLLETVRSVLAAAQAHRRRRDLQICLTSRNVRFRLENDSRLIPPLVDQLQMTMSAVGLVDDAARVQVSLALEEALLNALYHGNLELTHDQLEESRTRLVAGGADLVRQRAEAPPYRDRRIDVEATINPEEARVTIRDQGPGFDRRQLPDLSDPGVLTQARGRGYVLMGTFMDEVRFNERGNEVVLVRRRRELPEETSSAATAPTA